tara:strand:- start:1274 stop:1693 length:420 start_codon:yes stop_codon:yes gene_type:complete
MSTLKVQTIQDTSGGNSSTAEQIGQGRAKAWVNFDGTFGTSPFTTANGGIRSAFNVSSVTDNGTGDYTVTFSSAMSNANYAVALSMKAIESDQLSTAVRTMIRSISGGYSTSSFRICNSNVAAQTALDPVIFNAIVFGD